MIHLDDTPQKPGYQTVPFCAIVILCLLGSLVACQSTSQTKDGKILECKLLGGEEVKQPPGSGITACCYENGCWICDEKGNDCTFDPAYSAPFWEGKFKRVDQ